MTIQSISPLWLPSRFVTGNEAAPTFTGVTLNASGDKIGFVLIAPKSGDLHSFEFRLGTVGNTPDNGLRLSFQDVSLTTGNPDGTQDQFRDITSGLTSNTWQAPPGPITSDGTNGGTKRTVTKGDRIGCVIEFVTFVASDSADISVITLNGSFVPGNNLQYMRNASTGTYVGSTHSGAIALKYDDGNYYELGFPWFPALTFNTRAFNSASTPDERALRFQVPVPMRLSGVHLFGDLDNDLDLILYDNASSALATSSLDKDLRSFSFTDCHEVMFPSAVTLSANTTYRLAVKPGASSSTIYDVDLSTSALQQACWGGSQWYSSERTDGGAWTDTNTNRPLIGLIFDGIHDGSGSGGAAQLVGGGLVS